MLYCFKVPFRIVCICCQGFLLNLSDAKGRQTEFENLNINSYYWFKYVGIPVLLHIVRYFALTFQCSAIVDYLLKKNST